MGFRACRHHREAKLAAAELAAADRALDELLTHSPARSLRALRYLTYYGGAATLATLLVAAAPASRAAPAALAIARGWFLLGSGGVDASDGGGGGGATLPAALAVWASACVALQLASLPVRAYIACTHLAPARAPLTRRAAVGALRALIASGPWGAARVLGAAQAALMVAGVVLSFAASFRGAAGGEGAGGGGAGGAGAPPAELVDAVRWATVISVSRTCASLAAFSYLSAAAGAGVGGGVGAGGAGAGAGAGGRARGSGGGAGGGGEDAAAAARLAALAAALSPLAWSAAERCPGGATCSICLGEFEEGDACSRLPCGGGAPGAEDRGHVFHAACVQPWLLSHVARCPLCGTELDVPAE